jgi:hypothetical protein
MRKAPRSCARGPRRSIRWRVESWSGTWTLTKSSGAAPRRAGAADPRRARRSTSLQPAVLDAAEHLHAQATPSRHDLRADVAARPRRGLPVQQVARSSRLRDALASGGRHQVARDASISAKASSATACAPGPGMRSKRIRGARRARSMLSMPEPARTIRRSCAPRRRGRDRRSRRWKTRRRGRRIAAAERGSGRAEGARRRGRPAGATRRGSMRLASRIFTSGRDLSLRAAGPARAMRLSSPGPGGRRSSV